MNKDELKLVYVHQKGIDIRDGFSYQFLFSSRDDIDGEDWGTFPAMGRPQMPEENIEFSIEFTFDIRLDLAKDSSFYSMYDAVDGVVSIAYENIMGYEAYPDPRLVFMYGENYDETMKKLSMYDVEIKEKEWVNE